MRLPHMRFTIRRSMVAVAIAALILVTALWVVEMRRLSSSFHQRYVSYSLSGTRIEGGPKKGWVRPPPSAREVWLARMAEKYRVASLYPWLPVAPDPPEPE